MAMIPIGKLLGTGVFTVDGQPLGNISDIVIDEATGKVASVILASGGFLGVGDEHRELRWSDIRFDSDKGSYIADISSRKVATA